MLVFWQIFKILSGVVWAYFNVYIYASSWIGVQSIDVTVIVILTVNRQEALREIIVIILM